MDMVTNAIISERTGQEKLDNTIKKKHLSWMGHETRMDKESRANQVVKWDPVGRCGRGRPRKYWMPKRSSIPGDDMGESYREGDG
jgi:hypothetical protein